jgi:hypothetical protein
MFTFWFNAIVAFGTLLLVFNLVYILLFFRQISRLNAIREHISTEYSIKWFTLEQLTLKNFKLQECESVVIRMLIMRKLDSRDFKTNEPNDFQETVVTILGKDVFLDAYKLKFFLDRSEFRYIGAPPPRKKRRNRKLDWGTLLPQEVKPAFT